MIEIRNLRKTFPHKDAQNKNAEKTAVDGLSLTIETGEIFGLLGPNGAGKTTTIRMLTMLTRPTEGEILYDGKRVGDDDDALAIKQMIGVVPQNLNFDQDLTVDMLAEVFGVKADIFVNSQGISVLSPVSLVNEERGGGRA